MNKVVKIVLIFIVSLLFLALGIYLFFSDTKTNEIVENKNNINIDNNNVDNQDVEIGETKEVKLENVLDLNIKDTIDLETITTLNNKSNVTYKSSNPNVLDIEDGKVVAKSIGQTTVTVENNEEHVEYVVNVIKESVVLRSISLNYSSLSMIVNDEKTIEAKPVPNNAEVDIVFSSSDNSVVTVDNNGKVKALKPGKAYIYAKSNNIESKCTINVKLTETPIIDIYNNDKYKRIGNNYESHISETYEVKKNNNVRIQVGGNANYYIYSNKTSQNDAMEDIKTATKKPIIEPIEFTYTGGPKIFYIWLVDDNNVKSTHFIRLAIVEEPVHVSSVTISKTNTTLNVNATERVTASVVPIDADNKNIRWESANERIATVDNGIIKGLREGIVVIRAISEDGENKASITVNVKSTLFNTPRFMTMAIGEEKTISTKESNLTWRSSNSGIVRVNNGVVNAKGAGITNVTATNSKGVEEYIRIQVFDTNALGCAYDGIYMICSNKPNSPTKNKSASAKENDENTLDYILQQLNYNKRFAAIEAAKYLAYYYDRQVPYNTGQIYNNVSSLKRLNIYSNNCWGCDKPASEITEETKDYKYGIQCSGFVSWALLNAGVNLGNGVDLTKTVKSPSAYINSTYLSGRKTPYQWLIDNNKVISKFEGSKDKSKIVSSSNIKAISSISSWNSFYNLIQPGDLLGYGTDNGDETKNDAGHIGIIVDKYESGGKKYVVIAHSARWPKVSGPQLTRYSDFDTFKKNWYLSGTNQYANVVLMDEKYN